MRDAIAEVEEQLQCTLTETYAGALDADGMHDLLLRLGDLSRDRSWRGDV